MPGQQGIAGCCDWPRKLASAQEPNRIKYACCGLERTHHLHGSSSRLRRKHSMAGNSLQSGKCCCKLDRDAVKVQRCELIKSTIPLAPRLKCDAGLSPPGAPFRCHQKLPHLLCPLGVRPCIETLQSVRKT